MKALAVLLLTAVACAERPRPQGPDSARVVAAKAASDSAPTVTDSTLIVIDGPTLVAFYPPVTQTQVDTSEELATVFDDFSYHLSSAADSLRALGITVRERPLGAIRLAEAGQQRQFAADKDSADFGYLFLAPRHAQRVYYSVMSNSDLIEAAHAYLEHRP